MCFELCLAIYSCNLHKSVHWFCNGCSDSCSTGANMFGHGKLYKAYNEDAEVV